MSRLLRLVHFTCAPTHHPTLGCASATKPATIPFGSRGRMCLAYQCMQRLGRCHGVLTSVETPNCRYVFPYLKVWPDDVRFEAEAASACELYLQYHSRWWADGPRSSIEVSIEIVDNEEPG